MVDSNNQSNNESAATVDLASDDGSSQAPNTTNSDPSISDTNEVEQSVFSDCYFNPDLMAQNYSQSVVIITRVDMPTLSVEQSECVLGINANNFYMNTESIYFVSENNNLLNTEPFFANSARPMTSPVFALPDLKTRIDKFTIQDDVIAYQGNGEVIGNLPSQGIKQFYMSEKDGYFRIVTSDWAYVENYMFVLETDVENQSLNTVASLPNETYPEPIGKPNEEIFGVRFLDDKAYIITGEIWLGDPLYSIDLSNPLEPRTIGELDVPTFARYLHPLPNNQLLGFGRGINNNALEIALFDVSNDQPILLDSIAYAGWSHINHDYHAIASLTLGEETRVSIPFKSASPDYQSQALNFSVQADYLEAKQPLLFLNDRQSQYYMSGLRTIITDNSVMAVNENGVSIQPWQ